MSYDLLARVLMQTLSCSDSMNDIADRERRMSCVDLSALHRRIGSLSVQSDVI